MPKCAEIAWAAPRRAKGNSPQVAAGHSRPATSSEGERHR